MKDWHVIKAPTFLAWWRKLNELAEVQPDNTALLDLIDALVEVGRNAGAVRFQVQEGEPVEPPMSSYSISDVPDPAFDWVNGEIDILAQPMPDMLAAIGPDAFIAEVVQVTGISADYAGS